MSTAGTPSEPSGDPAGDPAGDLPPADWYADPWDPDRSLRWWDGAEWTGYTAESSPVDEAVPAEEEPSEPEPPPEEPDVPPEPEPPPDEPPPPPAPPLASEVEEDAAQTPSRAQHEPTSAGAPPGWEDRPRVIVHGEGSGGEEPFPRELALIAAGAIVMIVLLLLVVL